MQGTKYATSMRQHARQACNNMQRMDLNQDGQLSNRPKSVAKVMKQRHEIHIQTCMLINLTLRHKMSTYKRT